MESTRFNMAATENLHFKQKDWNYSWNYRYEPNIWHGYSWDWAPKHILWVKRLHNILCLKSFHSVFTVHSVYQQNILCNTGQIFMKHSDNNHWMYTYNRLTSGANIMQDVSRNWLTSENTLPCHIPFPQIVLWLLS